MATKKKSAKTFTIQLKIIAVIERDIEADSMEDALAHAEDVAGSNDPLFLDAWSFIDGKITVCGVDDRDAWNMSE